LLLWAWARGWFRGIVGAARDATAGTARPSRWPIVAAAVPLLALSVFVLVPGTPRAAEIASVEEATTNADASASSVGLFLSAWAERERDGGDPVAMTAPASHASSAQPQNAASKGEQDATDPLKARGPREAHDLLATAQDALARNALTIAAHAL